MTRIIAGAARGRPLRTPRGGATRPTADRVREALFSALESELGTVAGVRFLDLYAGSGAVGLEARSRGAAYVELVEADRATAALIRANAKSLGFDHVTVRAGKVERWVAEHADAAETSAAPFDVVYVDPPYSVEARTVAELLREVVLSGRLAADAVVVVERSRRDAGWAWPRGLESVRDKRYGETMLHYGRVTEPAETATTSPEKGRGVP